jgi:hypothetical protein
MRRDEICDWNLVDVEEASPATAPEIGKLTGGYLEATVLT